jgi:hypothetical protein
MVSPSYFKLRKRVIRATDEKREKMDKKRDEKQTYGGFDRNLSTEADCP